MLFVPTGCHWLDWIPTAHHIPIPIHISSYTSTAVTALFLGAAVSF